jgi:hypothetical protein
VQGKIMEEGGGGEEGGTFISIFNVRTMRMVPVEKTILRRPNAMAIWKKGTIM